MHCSNVVIVDRHPVVLQGLKSVLRAENGFKVVASCTDCRNCIDTIRSLTPEIAVLDLSLPGLTGLEILAIANYEKLSTRLVFFTASVDERELIELSAAPRHHSEGRGARKSAGVFARSGGRPEVIAAAALRSDDTPSAKGDRKRAERADGANRARAPDHASGVRRVVEQGNRAAAEYCRWDHQSAPP